MDQTQGVYAAEDLWVNEEFFATIRFGDWNEIWPFYYDLAERCRAAGMGDITPPTVKPRKGALRAHYDSLTETVHIPSYKSGGSWALNTATALHEFAHHLTPGEGHGPKFRAAMIDCLKALGWDHTRLEQAYAEAGLTTSSKGDGVTDKVSKLLTHADNAGTDDEQRVYLEKAESLAAEHSINLALIRKRAADEGGKVDRPTTGKMYNLDSLPNVTYRNLAVELATSIALAHGARLTIRGKSLYVTFYGYPEDIHLTELMLTRVTPMMFEAADAYLKTPEHKESGVASVSARIAFCQNFAYTVGSRLRDAVEKTTNRMQDDTSPGGMASDGTMTSTSTALALKEKEIEVADYVAYEFKRQGVRGSWSGSSTSRYTGSAGSAGTESARKANLFGRKELA